LRWVTRTLLRSITYTAGTTWLQTVLIISSNETTSIGTGEELLWTR
jgi:hypothetical protein